MISWKYTVLITNVISEVIFCGATLTYSTSFELHLGLTWAWLGPDLSLTGVPTWSTACALRQRGLSTLKEGCSKEFLELQSGKREDPLRGLHLMPRWDGQCRPPPLQSFEKMNEACWCCLHYTWRTVVGWAAIHCHSEWQSCQRLHYGKIKDKEKQPTNTAAMDVHSHSIEDGTHVDVTQLRGIKGTPEPRMHGK